MQAVHRVRMGQGERSVDANIERRTSTSNIEVGMRVARHFPVRCSSAFRLDRSFATYSKSVQRKSRRAKGPHPSQPGASPQENSAETLMFAKSRLIDRAFSPHPFPTRDPGALPQAGMGCAFGAQEMRPPAHPLRGRLKIRIRASCSCSCS